MILPGHIALAILGHTMCDIDLPTTVSATLAPDIMDKGASHAMHITPAGRYAMHSLSGWVVCTCLVHLLAGKRRARSWAAGHMLHLLGDRGDVPWFFPFKQYAYPPRLGFADFVLGAIDSEEGRTNFRIELFLLALALIVLAWRRWFDSRSWSGRKGAKS